MPPIKLPYRGLYGLSDAQYNFEWIETHWPGPSPIVTTLPTNPTDGQICYFVADATNGVLWALRYNAAWTTDAYKWQFIGGGPVEVYDGATATPGGPVSVWVGPYAPPFPAPRSGVYRLELKLDAGYGGTGIGGLYTSLDKFSNPRVPALSPGSGGQMSASANLGGTVSNFGLMTLAAGDFADIIVLPTATGWSHYNRMVRGWPVRLI